MSTTGEPQAELPPDAPLRLEPRDEHNRRLISRVHPPDWPNPSPHGKYHLVIVGAGTAGLVSAAIASALGARVALIERHLMGGDCLNFGCVPSKALLRAARGWSEARLAEAELGGPQVSGAGDFGAVMERMRKIRSEIAAHDSAARFRELGVHVFFGAARFGSPGYLRVDGTELRFRRAIIASGARPYVPPIQGLSEAGYLTTETVFGLTRLPRRLAVVGGGPIGVELAQAFARFRSQVTVFELRDRLIPREDPDASTIVHSALERDGARVLCGAAIESVARDGGELVLRVMHEGGVESIRVDEILIASGRAPNVDELDLDAAGIRASADGIVTDARLRTTNPNVFAVGDAIGGQGHTHRSDAHARIAVRNALFWGRARADRLVIPRCVFTDPEIAHVGITDADAALRPDEVVTITVPADAVDRSRLDGLTDGFLRLHLRRRDDTILGATLVHPHAGELIAVAAHAITSRTRLAALGETVLPYPTGAELFRRAADLRRRGRLTPRARRLFEAYFRVLR